MNIKTDEQKEIINTKCGFIALLGATNSGKSTLLNTILENKVSITSHKVQTTRTQIRGIKTEDNIQMIFTDTPGVFSAKEKFDRAMVSAAWSAMDNSNCILFLLDAKKGITKTFDNIVTHLKTIKTPIALCLNKIDLIDKSELLTLVKQITESTQNLFEKVFMISALNNDGIKEIIKWIKIQMPTSPFLYNKDFITDLPIELQLAEITREKIYELLHQELPYKITVVTDSIKEEKKYISVEQTIYTSSKNHTSIIIGKKGSKLKAIGIKARCEMEHLLNRKINLQTIVKLKENWRTDEEFYTNIGLTFKG